MCATTITVSVTIPLFGALAGGLYVVSAVMLWLYLPAANHLKKLRMNTAGECVCYQLCLQPPVLAPALRLPSVLAPPVLLA